MITTQFNQETKKEKEWSKPKGQEICKHHPDLNRLEIAAILSFPYSVIALMYKPEDSVCVQLWHVHGEIKEL